MYCTIQFDIRKYTKHECYKKRSYLVFLALFDRDYSGTIDMNEFNSLWGYINQWRQVFSAYDQDRSGSISQQELHTGVRI